MRVVLLALAALLVCVAPASAQKAPSEGAPAALRPEAPPPSEAEANAARAMLRAFILDSGLMDAGIDQAVSDRMPELRETVSDPGLLAEIGPEAQARIATFMETLPNLLREEIRRTIPIAIENALPEVAVLFTEEEMNGITEFLSRPETRDLLLRMVRGERGNWTRDDIEMAEAFGRTHAGRAFIAQGDAMFEELQRSINEATPSMMTSLTQRLYSGICEALAEQCPASIRDRINPI